MQSTIIQAIRQKKILSLRYSGIMRIVEPHAYGVSRKGNDILRCYQVRGGHDSYTPHDWDLLNVDEISSLTDTGEHFAGARPDYRRDDKAMQTIYAQL